MSRAFLELNDCELLVARGGKVVARSPGVAVLHNGQLELGEKGARVARLDPRRTFNRFWRDLNQDPLPFGDDHVRHHADLAFAQLLALHEQSGRPGELVIAVPGSFTNEQLALLLGLAQAGPMSVVGLIDASVAAASAGVRGGILYHVDLHLHHAVVTTLEVSDYVERKAVRIVEGAGQVAVLDAAAAVIADLFIQQARLDPIQHAQTEQRLYDQLPASLRSLLRGNEVLLEVHFGNIRYQARLLRDALIETLEPLYSKIAAAVGDPRACLLSHRAAALPGLAARLPGCEILDEMAVFAGCTRQHFASPSTEAGVAFLTRVESAGGPGPSGAAPDRQAAAKKIDGKVTHVLIGKVAYPVLDTPLYVGPGLAIGTGQRRDAVCSVQIRNADAVVKIEGALPAFLNGRVVGESAVLRPGDQITFEGTELALLGIRVAEAHGTG